MARSRERGFSLIEIMVAVTLLTVITVGLLAMFYQTQRAFRLGAGQVDVLEGGRGTMQIITRELQEMLPSHLGDVMNFEVVPSPANLANVQMNVPGGGLRTNWLQNVSFLTRRGDEWVGVTYRVDHVGRGAGTLYRAVLSTNLSNVDPRDHWKAVSNLFAGVTRSPVTITTDRFLRFQRIADGVAHLKVNVYNPSGVLYENGVYIFNNGTSITNNLGVFNGYQLFNWVPGYIDVELGILDPKATELHFAKVNQALARTYLEGQAHRMQLFKQRVQVRSRRSEFDLFAGQ